MIPVHDAPLAAVSRSASRNDCLPHVIHLSHSSAGEALTRLAEHADAIRNDITRYGAVLLRGARIDGAAEFSAIFATLLGTPTSYSERSSPRRSVYQNVYTSTDYRNDRSIFLHNEQSYNNAFVRYIAFYCALPAATGGETPLADTRKVLLRIDPAVRAELIRKGYVYRRTFGFGLGPSWQEAFGLASAGELEEYCGQNEIDFTWVPPGHDRLITQQRRPVIARHPVSRVLTWFNHMTFFHVLSLEPELRELLETVCRKEEYPHSTLFGDGTDIPPEMIESLREAYLAEEVTFDWMAGDILMIDNMLVAHGRRPFTGPRELLVAMSTPTSWKDVMI